MKFVMNSSILVIGAGTAGLSAASELLRNGFTNVKVYEARDRLGGRIFSKRRNGDSNCRSLESCIQLNIWLIELMESASNVSLFLNVFLAASVIELGAQWIHGQVGNPVYDICKEEGLLDESLESLYAKFYHWRQIDREQNGRFHPDSLPTCALVPRAELR